MNMKNSKIVAIHQPNFFPWLGYFDKILRAHVFILLDDVQFSKTGGTWVNRVRILVNGKAAWVTIPIVRSYHGVRKINEMEINDTTAWREKLLRTVQMNYARAPFFGQVFPLLKEWLGFSSKWLCEFNLNAIYGLINILELADTEVVLQSSLHVDAKATDLLVELIKTVDGSTYLCGGGAEGYQEDEKFAQVGLSLEYQNFNHPPYVQKGVAEFVPGLSVLDALMHCGVEGTQQILKQGNVKG
jgi:hypothetical protein